MNILVTGANGLLGRRLVEKLIAANHTVHALVHSTPADPVGKAVYHVVDLGLEWDSQKLPRDVEVIYHLAQSHHFRDFPNKAMDIFKVNVDSTARLLEYAQKISVSRFIYASSGGVYGAGPHIINENSPMTPHPQLGYYLGSKLCSEILVENYAQTMQVNIARFFFIYGPEQKRSMLMPRLVDSVREGRPIQLQGNDGILINPIHVSDAVNAIEKMLDLKENVTFNIAGGDIVSVREIAETAGQILGKSPVFESVTGEPKNMAANIDLMKTLLVPPSVSLHKGLVELI